MILEVIKVLYHLLRCGFYPYDEIPALCRSMLHMLDGKNDTTGLENEREGDRYRASGRCAPPTASRATRCSSWRRSSGCATRST